MVKITKLVVVPPDHLDYLADTALFTGYLNDDGEFYSDASFYDDTDDDRAEVFSGGKSHYPHEIAVKGEHLQKNFKMANRKGSKYKDREKQLLKKGKKSGKWSIVTEQQSASDNDSKSGQETSPYPEKRDGHMSKLQKFLKKRGARFSAEPGTGKHRCSGSASLYDVEVDVNEQRKTKPLESASKKKGTIQVKSEYGSANRSEKVRGAGLKEAATLNLEKDEETGTIKVKAFHRRKKLCKAVDLVASASEKGHKGKGQGNTVERSGSKLNYSLLEGTSDSEAPNTTAQGMSPKASPSKGLKQGLRKEQKLGKDKEGLWRAEIYGEGRNRLLVNKSFPISGHSVKGSKHKDSTHEDVAGSSSTGKEPGSSKILIPAGVDSKMKPGQGTKERCASLETVHSVVEHQRRAVERDFDNGVAGEEVSSGVTEGAEGSKEPISTGKGNESGPASTEVGWVSCDNCQKWRCIPASLAEVIEATDCRWFCKDNPNKEFADCSIPQEKSNAEINAELEISEVSYCEDGDNKHPAIDSKLTKGSQHQSKIYGHSQSTWTSIKHNIFKHRPRKTQTIDEQMVCSCTPPEYGGDGCGENCFNRMLSIECLSDTCPCKDHCSNQQFQRRLYTKVSWFRCGKKGFGLQVLEDVSKGAFIIEYVGEVLDLAAYEARQKEYALGGQKHFYFMTLNSSEVIDACFKGNLGRFINHSCEPNCTTEKWMVNGEVCIGLFAIRDLKKGEEITFDYNYVRIHGAAAKKCLCGSHKCRGFIGGNPTTPQFVIHSESDEDDPEPIMIEESSEEESQIDDSKLLIYKKQDENVSLLSKERQGVNSKQKAKSAIRKLSSTNSKRLTIETGGGPFEGVEERLNELLDETGGLCKGQFHADEIATRYLKLLWETAASGDTVNGEGSRSTRDLSMVLDVLLKTQSRAILSEVITKGFQILHNMLKKSRMDYKKTPIIRKTLKVLECLAVKRILSPEQINAQPARPGAESVKETICQLCRHADMEVQQIASQFEVKWLKSSSQKPPRKGQGDLSKWRLFKSNQIDNSRADAAAQDEASRKRKRPSRWDQPSQEVLDTTLAGGLPKSFWPFNANNLLLGNRQQNSVLDHSPRHTETAASDDLGTKHPGVPAFPVMDNQHHIEIAEMVNDVPVVVSGIPVEPFTAGSSLAYLPQQGSVCIGIPVYGTHTQGTDCSYRPQMFMSAHQVSQVHDGQGMPFTSNIMDGQRMTFTSNIMDAQEQKQCKFDAERCDQAAKERNLTFGISQSQFFQQMHGLFGSAFHPWQLQSLLAPHAWGPYLSGDARSKFVNDPGAISRQADFRVLEENAGWPTEPDGTMGYAHEMEPPVPGLSPLPPPPPPPPFASSGQAQKRPIGRQFEQQGRGNLPHQPLKSRPPQRWNSPRFSKFQGHKSQRNVGFRRDFNPSQRNSRPNFPRQGSSRSHHHWEDAPSRQHSWGYSRGEESMDMQAPGGPYGICHNESFQDSGNPSGSMPLERPWGYGQEENYGGVPENYSGQFPREG